MAEYIDRKKVEKKVLGLTIVDPAVAAYADAVLFILRHEPVADVAPVVHGQWISVKDKLPKDERNVLAYYGFNRGDGDLGMRFIGVLSYFAFDQNRHWQHEGTGLTVTHWMPLPEPPTEVD